MSKKAITMVIIPGKSYASKQVGSGGAPYRNRRSLSHTPSHGDAPSRQHDGASAWIGIHLAISPIRSVIDGKSLQNVANRKTEMHFGLPPHRSSRVSRKFPTYWGRKNRQAQPSRRPPTCARIVT